MTTEKQFKKQKRALIKQLVCEAFQVSWDEITGERRVQPAADARKTYMFLALTELSQTVIHTGNQVNRHYTTAIHARSSMYKLISANDSITDKLNAIKTKLYEHSN